MDDDIANGPFVAEACSSENGMGFIGLEATHQAFRFGYLLSCWNYTPRHHAVSGNTLFIAGLAFSLFEAFGLQSHKLSRVDP